MTHPVYYVEEDDTLPIFFDTFDGGDGSSITMTGLAVTDIEIYKDGSATQRSSDAGYTLLDTDGIDFDGITGIHGFSIDLSNNTDAGFFAVGSWYHVVVSSVTVDAQTVNFIAAAFRIVSATRGMSGTALPAAAADAAGGLVISDAGGLDIDTLNTNVSSILTDTGTTLDNHLTDIKGTGFVKDTHSLVDIEAYVDLIDDGTSGLAKIATDTAAVLVDTADMQPKLGTPAADIAADIAAVKVDSAAILTDTGTTLDTKLNDIQGATFNTATDSLEAIRDRGDAAWTTGAGGSDRLLMVDTTIATLATQTSFTLTAGSTDDDAYNNCTIVVEDVSTSTQKAVGMVLDYTGSTKTITLKEALAFTIATTDKVYILAENALKSTVANRQLDVTATGAAGIDWGNIENPTTAVDLSGTDIQLVDTTTTNTDMRGTDNAALASALTTHDGKLDTVDSNVDAILVDTAEIGAAGAGLTALATQASVDTVDSNVDAILVDTGTTLPATLGTPVADLATDIAGIQTDTTAIVADTNEIQTDWTNGGRLDLIIDELTTQGDTNETAIGALNDIAVADILTTQMTESYAADGVAPTLTQAVMLIQQILNEFAIAGTTLTVKKLDKTTTAATFTLDDGTTPTSLTRAT